jgi:XapX domain-containing protein
MKIVLGILVGLGLGAFCRWLDIPLPSPRKVVGAVMVLASHLGFVVADWALTREQPSQAMLPIARRFSEWDIP